MPGVRALCIGLLLAAAAVVATPAQACACGVALESEVTRERALVIEGDGRQEIIASFDLQAEGAGSPAVVLPVPGDPMVEEVETGDPLAYLDLATAPRAAAGGGGDDTSAAPTGGVDVIGRDVIGGYDVSRLRADDAGALDDWLATNGYEMPPGAEPIFDDYVEEGWRYVAIKLGPGLGGSLRPLRVSFDTEEIVYPMRLTQLGSVPVDLTLYVLADGERRVEGLDRDYSGSVADLDPAPPAGVDDILAEGTHLTKLTAYGADPASFTTDLEIGDGTEPPGWGPPAAIVLGVLGFGLLLFSRRA